MSSSIAAIHVARKQLDLDEDVYRAKLVAITGKSSTRDMSEAERQQVLDAFRKVGFQPALARTAGRRQLAGKYAKKLQALWIAAWNLGLIDNRDDAALIAFVKRQTGIDHARWLVHADDARKVIEALKAWMRREAQVSYGNSSGCDWLAADGAKVAWAQWRILTPDADLILRKGFDTAVGEALGRKVFMLVELTAKDWQIVMNALGPKVRAAKKGKSR